MLEYHLNIKNAKTHLFDVSLVLNTPNEQQRVALPVWIPGSYLVREFAKHLSALTAVQAGKPVGIKQLDKCSWEIDCIKDVPLELSWQVYAFDTSVRAAYLDQKRGFINGTSAFLKARGFEEHTAQLTLQIDDKEIEGWSYTCALPEVEGKVGQQIATLKAKNYDELVDSPIEFGTFWRGEFTAAGVPHEFVVAGAPAGFDGARLIADTQLLCEEVIKFWCKKEATPPYERYVFMLNAVDNSYGGLEHCASTALICKREDLPLKSDPKAVTETRFGYQNLLTLITHEFFHTWNVKRMRPAELAKYDYNAENYTELLWFFEGMTSYYEYLLTHRAGLLTDGQKLEWVARDQASVERMPGRKVQTVAQASFDAWVKFYRIDENTINSTISYYSKGAMVGLCLDLTLRKEGGGTLDDVMRLLWQSSQGGLIAEEDILQALEQVGGRSYQRELQEWVHGLDELPVEVLLQNAGVAINRKAATLPQKLGLVVSKSATGLIVKNVLRAGPAEQAGIAAGDELIAVNHWRLTDLAQWETYVQQGECAEVLLSRDAQLMTVMLQPNDALQGDLQLAVKSDEDRAELPALLKQWL